MCPISLVLGHSCSALTALVSENCRYGTLVQIALAYETRVGSPLDFQPERVSAPSCFRARCAALKQVVAQAGRRAKQKADPAKS